MYMKPIQVMFDEGLLSALDADEEVQERGRSAVLREAAAEYLRKRRRDRISRRYQEAYAGGVTDELQAWADEARWPES